MVSMIRRAIALSVALLVTALTLGRVDLNWTGRPGTADGAADPGRAAVTRNR